MPVLDGLRRAAGLVWTLVGLVFQLSWFLGHRVAPGAVTLALIASVVLLAGCVLVRAPWWSWVAGWLASVMLGLDFAGAVADRFGVFGRPGDPGVSWGSWPDFVDYTARLLPGFGHPVVVLAATAATAVEAILAVLLLCGWQRRWVAKAAAGLLTVYLVALGLSLGADEVARYAMPILVGGALLISSCPASRPTVGRTPVRPVSGQHPTVSRWPAAVSEPPPS